MLRPHRVHRTIEAWCGRYGPLVRFDLGPRTHLAIADVDEINAILRDRPEGFRRWREMKAFGEEYGIPGVFSQEGDAWRRSRRLVVTALNSNHLQRYFDVVANAAGRLQRRLDALARSGESFDAGRELTSYSLDVITALAFGHELDLEQSADRELQRHIQLHLRMVTRRLVAPFPYWRWIRLPADRRWERSLEALRSAAIGFIEEARARMKARPELRERPENFLESILAAEEDFDDAELVGNTLTLLLAGEDTTAYTLAWTIWMLGTRPQAQQRLAEEASRAFGEAGFATEYGMAEELRYAEAVLRESMRLKPVAPFLGMEPISDREIAGVSVPAGTRLLLMMRAAGLSSGVERAAEFDPDRWLEGADNPAPDRKSFLAFGAGPRFCPGRNLAFLEAKVALATIARNFEVELDPASEEVTEMLNFAMVPAGLKVRMRRRSARNRSSSSAPSTSRSPVLGTG